MKLIEALEIAQRPPRDPNTPELNVGVACGFTPLHFETFLRASLRLSLAERPVSTRSGLYGSLPENIIRLAAGKVDALVVLVEWPDVDPRLGFRSSAGWSALQIEDILEEAPRRLEGVAEALRRTHTNARRIAVCLPTLPTPPLGMEAETRLTRFKIHLRERVLSFACEIAGLPGLNVIDPDHLDEVSPKGNRLDLKSELASGFPYTLPHAEQVAALAAELLFPPQPKKGLITDLDDTLWRGIVGEVGIDGVAWDLEHNAQIHGMYQSLLAGLADRGALIAVASKNDPQIVEQALKRSGLHIDAGQLYPLAIGWHRKSESVRQILETWNIGAGDVVFVDDSLTELDEVRLNHPGIECVLFPRSDPQAAYGLLRQLLRRFAKETVSEEDRLRSRSIRTSAAAAAQRDGSGVPIEQFLEQSNGIVRVRMDASEARALELINKTNQFNLNGRRYTQSEWTAYLADAAVKHLLVSYEDKYGPLGKIAVLTGRLRGGEFTVENWVMSCRAFSRRIEHQTLDCAYRFFGAETVRFEYRATDRNGPMADFLASLLGDPVSVQSVLERESFYSKRPRLYHSLEQVQ
jgi:FkbH-like protein